MKLRFILPVILLRSQFYCIISFGPVIFCPVCVYKQEKNMIARPREINVTQRNRFKRLKSNAVQNSANQCILSDFHIFSDK